MKTLLLAPLLLLCSCMATQAAVTRANDAGAAALAAAQEAKDMAGNPQVTQAELDAAVDRAATAGAEAKDAALAVVDAIKEDAATARAGISGMGMGMDGGLIGLALTGLSWFARDRRKRQGLDPLQRANVPTPPTIGGAA